MIKIRYVVRRDKKDGWPVEFRPDCERTKFDWLTGKDEGLYDMMIRLDKHGFDVFDEPYDFRKSEE